MTTAPIVSTDHVNDGLWQTARSELIENVKNQSYFPNEGNPVFLRMKGRLHYLPAYIPYIGPEYFNHRPRVLCYAINQNISMSRSWTQDWLGRWVENEDASLDRMNHAALNGESIPLKPYVEGFIPLIALMAIAKWVNLRGGNPPHCIDKTVAVTNFVKFSTMKDASSSSIPRSWWKECASRYVRHEMSVLRPDIVIGFGQKTCDELSAVIQTNKEGESSSQLLRCRFPARIPSIKAKPLSREERGLWSDRIEPLIKRIEPPSEGSFCSWKIHRFANYFVEVWNGWLHSRFL